MNATPATPDLQAASDTGSSPTDNTTSDTTPVLTDGQMVSAIVGANVIAEYLDDLAGGKLVPTSGPARWRAKSDHSLLQEQIDAGLLTPEQAADLVVDRLLGDA